jgi:hypothetical protein
MRTIFKDKTFLRAMIAIALPITLQNLVLYTTFLDG